MSDTIILQAFPEADEFYKTYWNKKPFIVRGAIEQEVFKNLIDGDSLAGLALEETIKSRLVITQPNNEWECHHGPLDENIFSTLEDENWSLLVQNVDQYHPQTAQLLKHFNFSPRWLMDDIMVSYSTVGGSVGPHMDSYHVFLVQGQGRRTWKISHAPIESTEYVEDIDLLVLKDGFEGTETEVSMGDVIYIPPHFGHQGVTTEEAMTFSVGFLGPKMSEIFAEYSHYLEQNAHINTRYTGQGLDVESAAFSIAPTAMSEVQSRLIAAVQQNDFAAWVVEYFSISTHDELPDAEPDPFTADELISALQNGKCLYCPEHIKLAMSVVPDGAINLSAYGENMVLPAHAKKLVDQLNQGISIVAGDVENEELLSCVVQLYNQGILYLQKS